MGSLIMTQLPLHQKRSVSHKYLKYLYLFISILNDDKIKWIFIEIRIFAGHPNTDIQDTLGIGRRPLPLAREKAGVKVGWIRVTL